KASLPFLFVPLVMAFLRPRSLFTWPMFLAVALLAFSVTCRVQIGIRLVLPVIAFGLIGIATALAAALHVQSSTINSNCEVKGWRRRLPSLGAILVTCISLVWTVSAAARVWPDGVCYTNACWGGTAQGYLVLSDSNYDWGQGLKEL